MSEEVTRFYVGGLLLLSFLSALVALVMDIPVKYAFRLVGMVCLLVSSVIVLIIAVLVGRSW